MPRPCPPGRRPRRPLPALVAALVIPLALAPAAQADDDDPLDNVTIIGHKRDVADVPGSAHVVDAEELAEFLASDVLRVLRTVPGVYVQEEEGFGLRPNIGIRGSGLDRSARIAVLEDGVLIAPAPYAAPAAYYFPTQRRVHAVEVLKGPASIAVGPRTTGGAINLISTPIPDATGGRVDLRLGQHDTLDAWVNYGMRGERFSWLAETVQAASNGFKTLDGPSGLDTGFDIQDYLLKLQLDGDPASPLYQSLRLKAGYTDQLSDETYLGLTDEDFAASPYRRYAASAGDEFDSEHEMLQLGYVVESAGNWRAEVTAYRNDFARNWFKVDSVGGIGIGDLLEDPATFATELSWVKGADSPDDAIVKRNNNREYYSQGIQGDITWDFAVGADSGISLTAGFRVHEDEEDRLQWDTGFRMEQELLVQTSTGTPGSQTNRVSTGEATALYVDSEIRTGRWIFTPGVRFEDIELVREDYSTSDPGRSLGPTSVREHNVTATIPGLGVLYRLNEQWRLLAGVHEGYNPPAPGTTADAETSLSFEAGTRYQSELLAIEAIYFLNDYDNLVGTVTASTGGGGQIGDQFDGGEVTVEGLELSASRSFGPGAGGLGLPLGLKYTWTAEAEFHNAFESEFEPWGDVQVGDELPYIPEHQLRATAGLEGEAWAVNLAANYASEMRAVAGQGSIPPNESIESHVVWDLLGNWQVTDAFSAYVKVDNLFDEVYVAARRPAGVRPGLERTAYAGVIFGF